MAVPGTKPVNSGVLILSAAVFSLAAAILATSLGLVGAHGEDGVVHTCVNSQSGTIRIVESPDECRPVETTLDWNQVGPTGPIGPTGATGSQGDKGDKGLTGDAGINCWDLDGDRYSDPDEDTNSDGLYNGADCTGADGQDGQSLGVACQQNQVLKYNLYAQDWQCSDLDAVVGNSQELLADGVFIVPDGVSKVLIEAWGSGGNGGDGGSGFPSGGGGGGGSGGYSSRLVEVTQGQEFSITVGQEARVASNGVADIIAGIGTTGADGTGTSGGTGGAGGIGETAQGNPGASGALYSSYSCGLSLCFTPADGGVGGAAVFGASSTLPPGGRSTGGTGGDGVLGSPGSPGGTGYVLIRW